MKDIILTLHLRRSFCKNTFFNYSSYITPLVTNVINLETMHTWKQPWISENLMMLLTAIFSSRKLSLLLRSWHRYGARYILYENISTKDESLKFPTTPLDLPRKFLPFVSRHLFLLFIISSNLSPTEAIAFFFFLGRLAHLILFFLAHFAPIHRFLVAVQSPTSQV